MLVTIPDIQSNDMRHIQ